MTYALALEDNGYKVYPILTSFGGYVFGRDAAGVWDPTDLGIDSAGMIAAGDWIALRRIAPSFSGLRGEDARAAYLQSIVTAEYIETRTTTEERARMLRRIGEGWSVDQALYEALGVDTDGLDAAVRERIVDEFPEITP